MHRFSLLKSYAEMNKVIINFSPLHLKEIFELMNVHACNLRQNSSFPGL